MSSDIEIINDECQQIMLEVKGQSIEIDIDDKMRDVIEENAFLKQERERLIKKLEKIENLSRYAWQQVRNKPGEAEELFKMINLESK